jgi:hypothetical protein
LVREIWTDTIYGPLELELAGRRASGFPLCSVLVCEIWTETIYGPLELELAGRRALSLLQYYRSMEEVAGAFQNHSQQCQARSVSD